MEKAFLDNWKKGENRRKCKVEIIKFKNSSDPGDYKYKYKISVFGKTKQKNKCIFTINQEDNSSSMSINALKIARRVITEFDMIEIKE